MTDTLAPPSVPILARVSTVGDVLDGLKLDADEVATFITYGINLAAPEPDGVPSLVTIVALVWLQARRTTHPGISWEDAEPLILLSPI